MEDRTLLSGGPGVDYVDGEILVGLKEGYTAEDFSTVLPTGYAISSTGSHGLVVLDLPSATSVDSAVSTWDGHYMLSYAEPNHISTLTATTPNDPDFGNQWSLKDALDIDIDADLAWDIVTDASSVVVAVIDSGIDLLHPDLSPNLWINPLETSANGNDDDLNGFTDDVHGWDFVANTGLLTDPRGHGTMVSGIIGAVGNNSTGITGVAWDVQLMSLRALNASGGGTNAHVAAAIDYAVANGADVINLSLGGYSFSSAISTSLAAAEAAGIGNRSRGVWQE